MNDKLKDFNLLVSALNTTNLEDSIYGNKDLCADLKCLSKDKVEIAQKLSKDISLRNYALLPFIVEIISQGEIISLILVRREDEGYVDINVSINVSRGDCSVGEASGYIDFIKSRIALVNLVISFINEMRRRNPGKKLDSLVIFHKAKH